MHVIVARNVNEAYPMGAQLLRQLGRARPSRNGPVLSTPYSVSTLYLRPRERVLYDPVRDANPFFHLMDALWCLAARSDVAWLTQFNRRMPDYSDNGRSFHGAYGWRWRRAWGVDQLHQVIAMLQANPTTRRAVLQMWDASLDLNSPSKDLPCNLMVQFQVDEGRLNMIVFNRSNDMIWGAYGANAVQYSMLQEYIAQRAGFDIGWYEQVSGNFHVYVDTYEEKFPADIDPYLTDPYAQGTVAPLRLVDDGPTFDTQLDTFMNVTAPDANKALWEDAMFDDWKNVFITHVALPMVKTWRLHKAGRREEALFMTQLITASDWALACQQWLQRRYDAAT